MAGQQQVGSGQRLGPHGFQRECTIVTPRIGIDGTPLLGERSGVGNYTGRLLAALLKLTPQWEYLLFSNRPLNGLETELQNATQVKRYFQRSRWLWMQTVLPGSIRRTRADLCHFTNALAPLWQPAPFVLTIHDASLYVYGHYHPRARHLTMRMTLPIVARRASAIITVSNHSRDELVTILGLPREKIHVVYEAAAQCFRPVREPGTLSYLRRKYRLPDKFLLFVGTLEPRKNLVRLARAIGRVRRQGLEHKVVLVGPMGWMMEGFEREVEALGLKDDIIYLGYVAGDDLPGIYSLATAFVFPSLYEGFGLPPLEAMACGTPVLTSDRSSLAEVCGEAALLVDPNSEKAIAAGLTRLLRDETLQHELRQRGLQHVKQYSWERAARETASIYRRILNGT